MLWNVRNKDMPVPAALESYFTDMNFEKEKKNVWVKSLLTGALL